MKRRGIGLIILLMSAALLGVFGMQLYFIKESYALKTQLFDQAVNESLSKVANKVGKQYAMHNLIRKQEELKQLNEARRRKIMLDSIKLREKQADSFASKLKERQKAIEKNILVADSTIRSQFQTVYLLSEDQFQSLSNPKGLKEFKLRIDQNDYFDKTSGKLIGRELSPKLFYDESMKVGATDHSRTDSLRYLVFDPVKAPLGSIYSTPKISPELAAQFKHEDNLAKAKHTSRYVDSLETLDRNVNLVEDVASEMQQPNIPLSSRINLVQIDTLLKQELLNNNIKLHYSFRVSGSRKQDPFIFIRALNSPNDFAPSNTYRTALFPNDLIRDPGVLMVSFPNKNSLILRNMAVIMASSAGLILVLVLIFTYTIFSILRQKKIAEMKTDFINNMTHEFKTPVATIMIASEALKDPDIIEDQSRIKRLAGIIYDENIRLGNHIERVLNIARFEKEELKLEHEPVEMNDVISYVVDSMSLQLQKKDAKVELLLDATNATVSGDELHLSNVILNLLDNANKYSTGQPDITISTLTKNKHLIIKVKDKGIGMTNNQMEKIFDQFYRVHTGNLHDVKGFGLGLSYVQNIVKRSGGTVSVKSEKDKGSEFELQLPLG